MSDQMEENYAPGSPEARGILSRTIFESPVIKYIFQAHIRKSTQKDVVLVGECFIHFKVIDMEGRLQHLATKRILSGRIRDARILESGSYAEIKQDPALNTVETLNRDEKLPPDLLVLTLDPSSLVFLSLTTRDDGSHTILQHEKVLPVGHTILHDPCACLAVDPKSRALAIGAVSDIVSIMQLRPRQEWEGQMDKAIQDIIRTDVKIVILKVAFLMPPSEDPDKIYLAVLGSQQLGKIMLVIYTIDHTQKLDHWTVNSRMRKYPIRMLFELYNLQYAHQES